MLDENAPDDIEVDFGVSVNEPVSSANDIPPGHFRHLALGIQGNAARRFPDDFDQSDHHQSEEFIAVQV